LLDPENVICATFAVAGYRCTHRESRQFLSVRSAIPIYIIQLLSEKRMSGSKVEKSRINVGDRILVAEGTYKNCAGFVKDLDGSSWTVTVRLDKWPGTMVKMSMDRLKGKGWKEVKYPTSRTNDPINW